MRKLRFPSYEYIKSLPTYDKNTDTYEKYKWCLFRTPTSVYGRFSYNENGEPYIYFDVMENGYYGYYSQNHLGMSVKFNKANYAKICKHAQKIFESFYEALDEDCSKYWDEDARESSNN